MLSDFFHIKAKPSPWISQNHQNPLINSVFFMLIYLGKCLAIRQQRSESHVANQLIDLEII